MCSSVWCTNVLAAPDLIVIVALILLQRQAPAQPLVNRAVIGQEQTRPNARRLAAERCLDSIRSVSMIGQ
jgi:hypothetical protein